MFNVNTVVLPCQINITPHDYKRLGFFSHVRNKYQNTAMNYQSGLHTSGINSHSYVTRSY